MSSFLVIGATGNVGSALVNQLHEQGHHVRALVRSASRAELLPAAIDIAVGDLDDAESLTGAARDVDGVFFMQLAPLPAQAENMIKAARTAGVHKLVVLSSVGTVLEPLPVIGARIAARDQILRDSGLDVTYLRANALMSNATWWLPTIRDEGRVYDASDPGKTVPVDPFDIARVAAVALTQDNHAGCAYILNGPQALTAREQVEILADVLGRPVEFVPVTPEQFARQSIEQGTPPEMAVAVQNLNELFRAGRAGVVSDDITNLTGIAPRTFRQWCEEHAGEFH
ncbi:NAD(P)H-binding protein [Kitasatospora cathayae]|uniref:NAD(P)H-binding protein n=1 Tax=Kitasatospora cathayae TaxID=3004092 RepID=A0ABY7Q2A7_9ACTN|nr:NAD(P)H-binding protein [Kitasatospora sp. HUAS 3-15]WBP86316.1 NAD(P)H-binding protein [Kitasatospora sp. HUAS 3-15]